MNDLFRIIGAVIFSIIMYAIPILETCGFAFHWSAEVQAPLTFLCVLQLIYITYKNIERED
jgi:hypothetical protein